MGRRVVEEPYATVVADIMGPVTPSKSGFSYICRWGTPRTLLTDNGTEIINRDIRELTQLTESEAERVHRVIKMKL